MSKSTLKVLPALIVAITSAWLSQPAYGVLVTDQIVLTENSPTSLSATLNGSTAGITITTPIMGFPNVWYVTFSAVAFGPLTLQTDWIEPENASLGNIVTGFSATHRMTIVSDVGPNIALAVPNGSTVPFGNNLADGHLLSVTFNDGGATVPDTGATLSLFGLSLMGLAFLRRKIPA